VSDTKRVSAADLEQGFSLEGAQVPRRRSEGCCLHFLTDPWDSGCVEAEF
jgi:hypothetical protein